MWPFNRKKEALAREEVIKLAEEVFGRLNGENTTQPAAAPPSPRPTSGTYNGHPVNYIGPVGFADCARSSCMNTAPHNPGRQCIG